MPQYASLQSLFPSFRLGLTSIQSPAQTHLSTMPMWRGSLSHAPFSSAAKFPFLTSFDPTASRDKTWRMTRQNCAARPPSPSLHTGAHSTLTGSTCEAPPAHRRHFTYPPQTPSWRRYIIIALFSEEQKIYYIFKTTEHKDQRP